MSGVEKELETVHQSADHFTDYESPTHCGHIRVMCVQQ